MHGDKARWMRLRSARRRGYGVCHCHGGAALIPLFQNDSVAWIEWPSMRMQGASGGERGHRILQTIAVEITAF